MFVISRRLDEALEIRASDGTMTLVKVLGMTATRVKLGVVAPSSTKLVPRGSKSDERRVEKAANNRRD